MFKSILIANRGEIACRIIRTASRMGLRTIAVYSRADAKGQHVQEADEAHEIGPAPAAQSYLRADRILEVAQRTGAECIHPGYGFLSENAEFAESCATAGIVFVGPPPSAIRAMGLKDGAKALMRAAGVPVVPGYDGECQDEAVLAEEAQRIGFPVLIKAVAGGGGKGMRRVDGAEDFADALAGARREAQAFFSNDRVLIEKYISSPRHIEMQVFGDSHGNAVHMFERDCSLQRRHQKVIEEAPAPGMTAEVRAAMGAAAVTAATAVGYAGAGTIEFIADGSQGLRTDGFWFMEMNTRLQVEHPVTEAIIGRDLVELQLRVAAGEVLPFTQDDLAINGHAIEARLYAEDPANGFLPSPGPVAWLDFPKCEGIRVDAGVVNGGEVTSYYDPMIAKIIAHGADREEALHRLANALNDTIVAGPRCNVAFLRRLIALPHFVHHKFDTGTIERHLADLASFSETSSLPAIALGAAALVAQRAGNLIQCDGNPWDANDGFQLSPKRSLTEKFASNGKLHEVELFTTGGIFGGVLSGVRQIARAHSLHWRNESGELRAFIHGDIAYVLQNSLQTEVSRYDPSQGAGAQGGEGDGVIRSPMHGKLIALFAADGESVARGQRLAIVEAMKMEHVLVAPRDGVVSRISVAAGAQVAQGAEIMTIGENGGDVKNG